MLYQRMSQNKLAQNQNGRTKNQPVGIIHIWYTPLLPNMEYF